MGAKRRPRHVVPPPQAAIPKVSFSFPDPNLTPDPYEIRTVVFSAGELEAPLEKDLLEEWDKMAAASLARTAEQLRGKLPGSPECAAATVGQTSSCAAAATSPNAEPESGSRSTQAKRSVAPQCIANIPTRNQKTAHRCRNKAKYGDHCGLHATGPGNDDFSSEPEHLRDEPDFLPFDD